MILCAWSDRASFSQCPSVSSEIWFPPAGFHLNLVNTQGIVFRTVLHDVYVTGTVFIVSSYTSRAKSKKHPWPRPDVPGTTSGFYEPRKSWRDRFPGESARRHPWNITVISPIKYYASCHTLKITLYTSANAEFSMYANPTDLQYSNIWSIYVNAVVEMIWWHAQCVSVLHNLHIIRHTARPPISRRSFLESLLCSMSKAWQDSWDDAAFSTGG